MWYSPELTKHAVTCTANLLPKEGVVLCDRYVLPLEVPAGLEGAAVADYVECQVRKFADMVGLMLKVAPDLTVAISAAVHLAEPSDVQRGEIVFHIASVR